MRNVHKKKKEKKIVTKCFSLQEHNLLYFAIIMEHSKIAEVKRSKGFERFFPLLSLLFSDEVLSFDYVFNCLQNWNTNTTFYFVVLSNNDCDISVVLEEIYESLSPELLEKIVSLIPVNEFAKKIERVVCYKCKNYGSIISGRDPSISQIRLICEKCKVSSLDTISDLVWARRCGEVSQHQYKQFENVIVNIRSKVFQVIDDNQRVKEVLQSMMIIQSVKEVNLSKLLCLFTLKTNRGHKNGQQLIESIPKIVGDTISMLSICTAGLDSFSLFSKNSQ